MDPLAELAAHFSSLGLRVGVAVGRADVAEAKAATLEKRVVELQSENGRLGNGMFIFLSVP